MEKISFIIPLKKLEHGDKELLSETLKSITDNKQNSGCNIIVIGPSDSIEVAEELHKETKSKIQLVKIVNEEDYDDFFKQINKAAMSCTKQYFCILEIGDTITKNWVKGFSDFSAVERGSIAYLPITEVIDSNEQVISFSNEIGWANSFVDQLGYIDSECLKAYIDFSLNGAMLRTEQFISVGMFKPSLTIAAWYEFLLRATYNTKTVYVVPKIGYRHLADRENSYTNIMLHSTSADKARWLLETSKQEYYFNEDRNRSFEDENKEEVTKE